jgi:hypothetical protein
MTGWEQLNSVRVLITMTQAAIRGVRHPIKGLSDAGLLKSTECAI